MVGGGFALAGAALQQIFSGRAEARRFGRDHEERTRNEQHQAFVDLVSTGRRVQRALVDCTSTSQPAAVSRAALEVQLDQLTQAVAVVRLVVDDQQIVASAEDFEAVAKALEDAVIVGEPTLHQRLELTPLIGRIRAYEQGRLPSLSRHAVS